MIDDVFSLPKSISVLPWIFYWICLRSEMTNTVRLMEEDCFAEMLQTYFQNETILTVKGWKSSDNSSYYDNVIKILMNNDNFTFLIHDPSVNNVNFGCVQQIRNCFIFVDENTVSSDNDFDFILSEILVIPTWINEGRKLIAFRKRTVPEDNKNLSRKIIGKMWNSSKADSLVMIIEEDKIEFYTWFPYRQPYCTVVNQIVHLDTFKMNGFVNGNNLFPEKIKSDLEGCTLIGGSQACVPFVFEAEDDPTSFVDGLEVRIVNALAENMNFKLETLNLPEWDTLHEDKSDAEVFRLLKHQKIDMAFRCLMVDDENYFLAPSLSYYYIDSLSWFVPVPEARSHTSDVFVSFTYKFWLAVLFTFTASTVVTALLFYTEGHRDSGHPSGFGYLLVLLGMSVSVSVKFSAKNLVLRIFLFLFCTYTMHIAIAYQASLFHMYSKAVSAYAYSSYKEAVEDGLLVYLGPEASKMPNLTDNHYWNIILEEDRHFHTDDIAAALFEIAHNKTSMGLFKKATGEYLISKNFIDRYGLPQIIRLDHPFVKFPMTIFVSPGHPLRRFLTSRIYTYTASGLIDHWLKLSTFGEKFVVKERIQNAYGNIPLSMNHLLGAFFLLLILLGLSISVFLSELIAFYFLRRKKIRKPTEGFRKHLSKHKHRYLINYQRNNIVLVRNTDIIFRQA